MVGLLFTSLKYVQRLRFFSADASNAWVFLFVQKDGTYMFNLDAFIVKLCNLAQETGDDDFKIQQLRAAGLQVLSSMVIRMLLGHMLLTVVCSFHC